MIDRPPLLRNPRALGIAGATLATALGMAAMAAAGAPRSYLVVNGAALVIGVALLAILVRSRGDTISGPAMLAAAAALLATALFGTTIDDATRWARIGAVSLQPSLILLPLLVLAFARARGVAATLAMLVAALALALQPDRAMAATLVAGLAALLLRHRERQVALAFGAALVAFAVTLIRPDTLPATPFVEQVLAGALVFSPLAGAAVLAGAALLLLLPVLARGDGTAPVFAAVWLAILLAAVLGNYPTPVLGYGGSGIIGYLLCLAALPSGARSRAGDTPARGRNSRNGRPDLLVAAR
ncbi:hypothetical protein [Sandarakinorhabdus sp. DWP1-3-1]|uniref:hypothetical protein n=1 Tax=Sandarakinorhabdus sp. DWP1-3-1 TaxID=2804627 RepID=UPI003CF2E568